MGWFMALQWPGAWGDPEVPAVDFSPQGECAEMGRDRGMAELEGLPESKQSSLDVTPELQQEVWRGRWILCR